MEIGGLRGSAGSLESRETCGVYFCVDVLEFGHGRWWPRLGR
jgi:hypothetical protein